MKINNENFDAKLIELNAKIAELQREVKAVENQKQNYILNNNARKSFLLENSIDFKNVKLEKHDGVYFIIAEDDTFEYVLRLNKGQAEQLADDLDHQLGKDLVDGLVQKEIISNMFNPLFLNINEKRKH